MPLESTQLTADYTPGPHVCGLYLVCSYNQEVIFMQTIATLSKSTKQGLSVFTFVCNDAGQYWSFGGLEPRAIQFNDLASLKQAIAQWRRYGYAFGTNGTPKREPKPAIKKQSYISDPWSSTLPAKLQLELEALSA